MLYRNRDIHGLHLDTLRITWLISTKLDTIRFCVDGIQYCSNEGSHPIFNRRLKNRENSFDEIHESSSQEPLGQCQLN